MDNKTTILLVDDHKVLRDGLRALLESEPDMVVVAEAGTAVQAIALTESYRPDVIVMDLGLPDMSGLEAIRAIRQENKSSRIVVLSMYSRREFVIPAIEAGCDGYVPKSSTHTSLLQAIRVVLRGERYLHPTAATALVERFTETKVGETEQFNDLSEREQEVLRLVAVGFTSREIGDKLIISPRTVDTYRHRAMEKLGLAQRSDLVKFALRAGILDDYMSELE
ncbi:MAG: response regulator transcription factor [Chloroflexota bacterium]